jgi:hypothetical protein
MDLLRSASHISRTMQHLKHAGGFLVCRESLEARSEQIMTLIPLKAIALVAATALTGALFVLTPADANTVWDFRETKV